jgi:hypothetical protein
MIRQRAAETERNGEDNQCTGGTIRRILVQFTVGISQLAQPATSIPAKKLSQRSRAPAVCVHHEDAAMTDPDTSSVKSTTYDPQAPFHPLRFPTLFNDLFHPSTLLYAVPPLTTTMTYGEDYMPSGTDVQFRISQPTIEGPLDKILLKDDYSSDSSWASTINVLCGAATAIDSAPPHFSDNLNGSTEKEPEVAPPASAENSVSVGIDLGTTYS